MAVDDGPSRVADIAARLDKGSQYVEHLPRAASLAAGIIETPARGKVDFAIALPPRHACASPGRPLS